MTIEDKIKDEKLRYDVNKKSRRKSTLSSSKTDKCEYLTGENILLSDPNRMIEKANFTYSPLGQTFEKQRKAVRKQGTK